jgi:hypothetical protein
MTTVQTDDMSPADLRAEVSPVSERFGAFTLGNAVVVFDDDRSDGWILSSVAYEREALR